MVGLERETERVGAANKRGGVRHESCDPQVESCDSHVTEMPMDDTPMKESYVDSNSASQSCDSHVISEWTTKLKSILPLDFSSPQMVSVGLNIDHTPQTATKLNSLLTLLEGTSCICIKLDVFTDQRSSDIAG